MAMATAIKEKPNQALAGNGNIWVGAIFSAANPTAKAIPYRKGAGATTPALSLKRVVGMWGIELL
jgi:hypothetical protein